MQVYGRIYGHITGTGTLSGSLSGTSVLSGSLTVPAEAPVYEGPYEFTPSASAQTVEIAGMRARDDIIINPIPSNYGLVTYDGSGIRVS